MNNVFENLIQNFGFFNFGIRDEVKYNIEKLTRLKFDIENEL